MCTSMTWEQKPSVVVGKVISGRAHVSVSSLVFTWLGGKKKICNLEKPVFHNILHGMIKCCYTFLHLSKRINVNGRLRLWFNSFASNCCFHLCFSQFVLLILVQSLLKSWILLWFLMTNVQIFIDFYLDMWINTGKGEKCQVYRSEISLQEKSILPVPASGNFLLIQTSLHVMLHVFRRIFFIIPYHYLIQKDGWNQDLLEKI